MNIGLRIEFNEHGGIKAFDISNAEGTADAETLPRLLEAATTVPLIVWDVAPVARFADAAGLPVLFGGSLRVLLTLMGEQLDDPPNATVLLERFEALFARASLAVRTLHGIEVATQAILACQRYTSTHPALVRSPYAEWRTLHAVDDASPNFRMMALSPPLTTMRREERITYLPAPAGDLWVMVFWPDLPWRVLALLSNDAKLHEVLRGGAMYEALPGPSEAIAAVLRCNGRQIPYVREANPKAVNWGLAEAGLLCEAYRTLFPKATRWLDDRAVEAMDAGTVLPPYGYTLRTRKRRDLHETYRSAVTGVVQTAEASLLRQAMLRWDGERVQRRGREFLGVGSLIPLHDGLLYTLDRDVPIPPHVEVVKRLLFAEFPTEVWMGPSAGEFYRVDGPHFSTGEIALNLNLPKEQVYCPVCHGLAMTSKSLARHMVEAHGPAAHHRTLSELQ